MKANRFVKDENGDSNVDIILILALFLSIILVLVYVCSSVGGWFGGVGETITSGLQWFGETLEGGIESLGVPSWNRTVEPEATSTNVSDVSLETIYFLDTFKIRYDNYVYVAKFNQSFNVREGKVKQYDVTGARLVFEPLAPVYHLPSDSEIEKGFTESHSVSLHSNEYSATLYISEPKGFYRFDILKKA
jgi:Flp pilus assembly pilin Flp